MVLKRKRSLSELCSSPSSSSASSTSSSPPHDNAFGLFTLGMAGPSHLNSRTLKRFRDSRPSEKEVHQRTLGLLYSAQHRPSDLQTVLDEDTSSSAPVANAAAPTPQQSLHRFWNINSAPISTPTTVDQPMCSTSDCEDCGGSLNTGGDGMDVDGCTTENTACSACGKNVCFSCSVSNLGEQKRCLQCAGRKDAGWTGMDSVMSM